MAGGAVVGAVHDENAWAVTGRGAGHAGIFATIEAVLTFGAAVLEELDRLQWLVRERPGGTLRAGFDGKSPPPDASSAGTRMGSRAIGISASRGRACGWTRTQASSSRC